MNIKKTARANRRMTVGFVNRMHNMDARQLEHDEIMAGNNAGRRELEQAEAAVTGVIMSRDAGQPNIHNTGGHQANNLENNVDMEDLGGSGDATAAAAAAAAADGGVVVAEENELNVVDDDDEIGDIWSDAETLLSANCEASFSSSSSSSTSYDSWYNDGDEDQNDSSGSEIAKDGMDYLDDDDDDDDDEVCGKQTAIMQNKDYLRLKRKRTMSQEIMPGQQGSSCEKMGKH